MPVDTGCPRIVPLPTSLIFNNLPSDWIISFDGSISDTLVGDGLISDTSVIPAGVEKVEVCSDSDTIVLNRGACKNVWEQLLKLKIHTQQRDTQQLCINNFKY